MTTRVTQNMISNQLLRNVSSNLSRMSNLENQLSTARKLNAPSDDPVGITFSMRYRSELSANDQFQKNVDSAVSYLDFTDTMLGQAGNVMQHIRELAVQGSNGSNPDTAMEAIKTEIEEMYRQLVDIGNSKFQGKYVFNGQLTDTKPYSEANAMVETTDHGLLQFEMGPGIKLPINVTGTETFGETTDPDNAFQIIQTLITDLGNNNYDGVSQAIDKIDTRMNKLLEKRSEIGARTNRVELIQGRLEDMGTNLQGLQSKTEDADMAEVITNLKMGENVYQASLSAGAKIIQPSLVDFLR
ncbi:flagellar hook-associated protein FlgL [Paenibacillus sp. H1-7]|uniref:flagellar hook-associated protein FlgL n=1 Tax=Paenibacillus sp. H1-7 TaxID=2282849 RepID=UPI001EF87691|nr:flagellar hook-associated protein FlgL [Paenibacillus sp. H1-7]ULL19455.1 flagellar hook-associated protein FlgL [Paenibacillus sp. H1-7]